MNITISKDFLRQETFIRTVPEAFSQGGELLYEGRNTVKAFLADGGKLVVKKFKTPNIVQRVAYTFFKKSKAERAYIFAKMLRDRGVDTPREVAYIEQKRGLLLSDSYFVSTECTLPALSTLLRRPDFSHEAADALAEFVVSLHEKGVLHGDLNLTNILYERNRDGRYSFTLIDTNRSKFKEPTRAECLENMMRLTHDRPLLAYVAGRYAEKRGWDAGTVTDDIMRRLQHFEQRCDRKKRMKELKKAIGRKRTV